MVDVLSKYLSPLDRFLRQFGIEMKPVYINGKRLHHGRAGLELLNYSRKIENEALRNGVKDLALFLMVDDIHDLPIWFNMSD